MNGDVSCVDTFAAPLRRCRVAVVDDQEAVLAAVCAVLDDAGYEVLALKSPLGAGAALAAFGPDVVLLDVAMPALRGDALLRLLRQQRRLARTRFFLHSTLPERELRATVERCGADGIVKKGDPGLAGALERHGFAALR